MRSMLWLMSPAFKLSRVTDALAAVANVWFVILWTDAYPREEMAHTSAAFREGPLAWLLLAGALNALGLYIFGAGLHDLATRRRERGMVAERPIGLEPAPAEALAMGLSAALIMAVAGGAAYAPDPASMGRRVLNEVALTGLARGLPAAELTALLEAHYRQADNLSDRRMALVQAINAPLDGAWQQRLFEDFYQRWRDESLVVNLWFALQARARSTAAAGIEALERHPAFDRRNPNKLRALYGAFSQQNARNFHALDGSGYRLLAERIAEVDGANPQMAAGLAKALTRWRRFDAARQRLMVGELEGLLARDGLSRDLYEVVSKSLAG